MSRTREGGRIWWQHYHCGEIVSKELLLRRSIRLQATPGTHKENSGCIRATEHCVTFIINSLYFVYSNLIISLLLSYHFPLLRSPGVCWQLVGQLLAACFPAVSTLAVLLSLFVLSHTCGHLTLVFSGHLL